MLNHERIELVDFVAGGIGSASVNRSSANDNGENYSGKILTQTLMFAGQACSPTVLGMTTSFGGPSAVSDCGGFRKSSDGAAGVRLKFSA